MFRSKIFQKVFLVSLFLIMLSITSVVSLFYFAFEDRLHDEVRLLLQNEIHSIENFYQERQDLKFLDKNFLEHIAQGSSNRITIIGANGDVFFDSQMNSSEMEDHTNRPEIQEALRQEWGSSNRFSKTIKADFLYVAKKIKIGSDAILIRVARPVEIINRDLQYILWTLISIGCLIVLIASFLLYFSIQKPLSSITEVIQAAKELMDGKYHVRIKSDASSEDELSLLSNTMNHLASNLEKQMQSLKDSEKKLLDILTHLKDGLVVVDEQNKIVLYNDAWMDIFGLQKIVRGEGILKYIRNNHVLEMIESTKETRKLVQDVIAIEKGEKNNFYFTQSFAVEQQDKVLTVVSMSNITDVKRAEEMKQEFIANASHQLKTPMAAIQGYAETLMDIEDISEEKKKEYLTKITQRSATATEMVVKLLTLTKIENQFSHQRDEQINVKEFIESVLVNHEVELEKKRIKINYRIQDKNICINSYPQLLEIALGAIFENAIQYSPSSSYIMIGIAKRAAKVELTIQDQGMGIDEEEKEHIFERFYRSEKAQTEYVHGTGIGLALVDMCIQRLMGEIRVESMPGEGTTFIIQLPLNIMELD